MSPHVNNRFDEKHSMARKELAIKLVIIMRRHLMVGISREDGPVKPCYSHSDPAITSFIPANHSG